MNLKISEESLKIMIQHAEAAYPNECCGFFYGTDGEIREIEVAKTAANSKEGDQRRRFEISPKEYLQAELYANQQGTTLLGIYHSHPDHPARPSEYDLKQAVPFFSYIIMAVQQGEIHDLTSWRLDDAKQFEQEEIITQLNFENIKQQ